VRPPSTRNVVPVTYEVLQAASLDVFDVIVSAQGVARGKPGPEGYLLALEQLGVRAADAVAIEDTPPGIAAAKAAGLRCVALLGTAPPERLREADEIAPRLDSGLVDRLLTG
jgi:beta-phosphoglucomutase-like phosphatase (HAD superfamily)